ncbi:hypothetical protein J4460_01640 [Candidatus Woesearchaeota archaeon]|nr:MAG: hypothetical protein QS99_C0003G0006 [archaeon GW2011_AR4]MBS3129354.1 hypothetical protein [Candidatus Woesearchaeota archaeon]HIH37615.1 hypothetical protein [Candidatus Woesearchaeota archaeon]HIH48769.1 hypothetical protein [Candidatus Woesearchaeota archaeon]HIJ03578.1 hypothetical protein [Candidatus Woesearchaeota archaeon]
MVIGIGIGSWVTPYFNKPEQSNCNPEQVATQVILDLAHDFNVPIRNLPITYRRSTHPAPSHIPIYDPIAGGEKNDAFPDGQELRASGRDLIRFVTCPTYEGDETIVGCRVLSYLPPEETDVSFQPHGRGRDCRLVMYSHGPRHLDCGEIEPAIGQASINLPLRRNDHEDIRARLGTHGYTQLALDMKIYDPNRPTEEVSVYISNLTARSIDFPDQKR